MGDSNIHLMIKLQSNTSKKSTKLKSKILILKLFLRDMNLMKGFLILYNKHGKST